MLYFRKEKNSVFSVNILLSDFKKLIFNQMDKEYGLTFSTITTQLGYSMFIYKPRTSVQIHDNIIYLKKLVITQTK